MLLDSGIVIGPGEQLLEGSLKAVGVGVSRVMAERVRGSARAYISSLAMYIKSVAILMTFEP